VQKYTALIKQAIQQKWLVDDAMIGKSCQLNIRLASNGLVTKVTKLKGDNNVCRSAETAILQVYTLPVSSDPEVFKEFRDFNLTIGHKI
jgi:colicin import membrane protein